MLYSFLSKNIVAAFSSTGKSSKWFLATLGSISVITKLSGRSAVNTNSRSTFNNGKGVWVGVGGTIMDVDRGFFGFIFFSFLQYHTHTLLK